MRTSNAIFQLMRASRRHLCYWLLLTISIYSHTSLSAFDNVAKSGVEDYTVQNNAAKISGSSAAYQARNRRRADESSSTNATYTSQPTATNIYTIVNITDMTTHVSSPRHSKRDTIHIESSNANPSHVSAAAFDPLKAQLFCGQYPTFEFNSAANPHARSDPPGTTPIPLDLAQSFLDFNSSICSYAATESSPIRPNYPKLVVLAESSNESNFTALIRAGIVWDPRPECANASNTTIQDGIEFSGSNQPNLECAQVMANITNDCSVAGTNAKQGGSMFYKCAVFYWQPTSGTQTTPTKRASHDKRPLNESVKRSLLRVGPEDLPPSLNPRFYTITHHFAKGYVTGVRVWKALQIVLRRPDQWQDPDLSPWKRSQLMRRTFSQEFEQYCQTEGILGKIDQERNQRLSDSFLPMCTNDYIHFVLTTKQGLPPGVSNEFKYDTWLSPRARTIATGHNTARINPQQFTPTPDFAWSDLPTDWPQAPTRWASVVSAQWAAGCILNNLPTSVLTYVAQLGKDDLLSQHIVDEIYVLNEIDDDASAAILTLSPENPEFYALLGTSEGINVVEFLAKFADGLATRGNFINPGCITHVKTLDSVRINRVPAIGAQRPQTNMLFILKDTLVS